MREGDQTFKKVRDTTTNDTAPVYYHSIFQYCNVLEAYGLFTEEEKRSIAQHCVPTLVGVLSTSAFLDHKSSTVALTILNYELSFFNREISDVFCQLSNYANLHDSELMHCNLLLQVK